MGKAGEFFKKTTEVLKRLSIITAKGLLSLIIKAGKKWRQLPQQFKRLTIPLVMVIAAFVVSRNILIPSDFGKYGHYRASAVDEVISQEVRYIGHTGCLDCHDDIVQEINQSYHRNVTCEVCHGPGAAHIEDPDNNHLQAPRERGYCPLCHEYLPSRPTGFPQIVSESHNPMKPCISCHTPHDPKPPSTPKQCEACHAEIARTKALSHHVYILCTRCHETSDNHKVSPREYRPKIPSSREFCGGCHAKDAPSGKDVLKVDMATHGERYSCWQCHYPHLPEAR